MTFSTVLSISSSTLDDDFILVDDFLEYRRGGMRASIDGSAAPRPDK
ncbi:hypothetical protein [Nocardia exalbida]|nr:hypothetical protein [Nocardia exalbida]